MITNQLGWRVPRINPNSPINPKTFDPSLLGIDFDKIWNDNKADFAGGFITVVLASSATTQFITNVNDISKIITSDGASYTTPSASFNHTWNTALDLDNPIGSQKIRWFLTLTNSNNMTVTNASQFLTTNKNQILYVVMYGVNHFECIIANGNSSTNSAFGGANNLLAFHAKGSSSYVVSGQFGSYIFANCYNLIEIPTPEHFNLSGCQNIAYSFSNCYNLQVFRGYNLISCTNFSHAFDNCSSLLEFNNNVTSLVKIQIDYMFHQNLSLVNIQFGDNVIDITANGIAYTWFNCPSLIDLSHITIKNVSEARVAFANCTKMENHPVFVNFNCTGVANVVYNASQLMFARCSALKEIKGVKFTATTTSVLSQNMLMGCNSLEAIVDCKFSFGVFTVLPSLKRIINFDFTQHNLDSADILRFMSGGVASFQMEQMTNNTNLAISSIIGGTPNWFSQLEEFSCVEGSISVPVNVSGNGCPIKEPVLLGIIKGLNPSTPKTFTISVANRVFYKQATLDLITAKGWTIA